MEEYKMVFPGAALVLPESKLLRRLMQGENGNTN